MSKKLLLTLACLAPMAIASPALALDTNRTLNVSIDGEQIGTWTLRHRVVPTTRDGDVAVCQYTVRWRDLSPPGAPLSRTTLCKIDEYQASDNFDCEDARTKSFNTLIQKSSSSTTCRGFDDFGQQTEIVSLVGGEQEGGSISGVLMTASVGDVQSLQID